MAYLTFTASQLTSTYDPVNKGCTLDLVHADLPNVIALLICDFIIVMFLLAGLYRWYGPRSGKGGFRLGSLLWDQGVLYLALVSAYEIPSLVSILDCMSPKHTHD